MKTNPDKSNISRLADGVVSAIPKAPPDIVEWASQNVVIPGSARSRFFRPSVSPWIIKPLRVIAHDDRVRIMNFRKPVQSGGSTLGEVLLLFWIQFYRGFIQYNWSNDKRADERWDSKIESVIKSCRGVSEKYSMAKVSKRGEVDFGTCYFRMQGAFNPDNLDSDSIRFQINEEVHAWEAGHLAKARKRTTAVWNFKSCDISNAGTKGDQMDKSFSDGTQEHGEILCPGCGKRHRMRTRWEDDKPHLGGLRYNADKARMGKWEYNYNLLRPTIEFQMPCGFRVHNEDIKTRRRMSESFDYSEPDNKGAEMSHRSFTYQAVSVDYIDWMTLIKEKHDALRARSNGNIDPWRIYVTERECLPFDANDVPVVSVISVSAGVTKNRDGLPGNKIRFFSLDRQQGKTSEGEFPYWWLVIRDVGFFDGVNPIASQLVWEGRLDTDESVVQVLTEHGCQLHHGVADSGDDTTHVYKFCLKYGVNAIKGGTTEFYVHPSRVEGQQGPRRIFSPERPLHEMIGSPPKYPYIPVGDTFLPDPREPMFWLYSKQGIRERFWWFRSSTDFRTPADVSDDYKAHMDSEERVEVKNNNDEGVTAKWIQRRTRNDLFVCECYIAMQIEMAGMIG